jgi:hypothetical protein
LEAKKRLEDILKNPELIFYESAGASPSPVHYYEALKREGYKGAFLDFVAEIVEAHFRNAGLELELHY